MQRGRGQEVLSVDLNPVLTPVRDLGEFIREQRTAAQISVRALAAKAGVSNPYLSQVERGLRRPSAEILGQIAHGLSISVETLLAKAGILETAEAPTVVIAIRADEVLTERQKSALVDIYAAFRKEAEAAAAALATPVTDAAAESAVAPTAPGPPTAPRPTAPRPTATPPTAPRPTAPRPTATPPTATPPTATPPTGPSESSEPGPPPSSLAAAVAAGATPPDHDNHDHDHH
jgi:transcriptional regulator with XRE-family HTH domain